jgi:hypothetical protein
MSYTSLNYSHLRLKLAIRKAMLTLRDRQSGRKSLLQRFPWADQGLFDAVVEECLREGTLTQKPGQRGAEILMWHEERVQVL